TLNLLDQAGILFVGLERAQLGFPGINVPPQLGHQFFDALCRLIHEAPQAKSAVTTLDRCSWSKGFRIREPVRREIESALPALLFFEVGIARQVHDAPTGLFHTRPGSACDG